MPNNIIDKIRVSGVTYDIVGQGGSGVSVVEVTQAEYNALPSSAKTDTSKMYVITDAEAGDLTNYYTKTETNTLLAGKQDTLSAGTNITIVDNVISAEGGGKAISAGTNISITTGETADTINCTLNAKNGTGASSIIFGNANNISSSQFSVTFGSGTQAKGIASIAEGEMTQTTGWYCHSSGYKTLASGKWSNAEGYQTTASTQYSHTEGIGTKVTNNGEHSQGMYNTSSSDGTTSGNTLFSVGNGTADNARHNAFEIRQNGDIYIVSGGTDIKLQDHLGGGGSGTVSTAITSGDTNAVAGGAVYDRFDEVEQVTAQALNVLNDRLDEDEEVTAAALNILNESLSGKQDTLSAGTGISISGNVISTTGGGGGGTVESAITSGSTNAVESKAIWSAVTYEVSINETLEFDNTYAATNYPSGCNSVIFEHNTGGTLPTGDYVFTSGGSEVAKLTCSVISWWPYEVGWTSSNPKLTYVASEGNSAVTASYSELASDIDGVTVPGTFTSASTATASGENHLWINENTYRKDEVYNKSEINVLSGIVDTKLDATAYTPTVVDSALNVASTNPVQNQALYSELRIESETTLIFEGQYSTNYPAGCTKIKVEVVGSNNYSSIDFYDNDNKLGDISISNYSGIFVTNNFQGASYEISGSSVIISYPTVTTVARLNVNDNTKYTYKAITSSTTPLKNQVVANTTALGGKVNTSAITTSISSGSTDSQIPSAKAVYDVLGDVETLLSQI